MSKRKLNSRNRICELPTLVQHHILSFLQQKEVARTAVLSKTWRSVVKSCPVLEFDQCLFLNKPKSHNNKYETYESVQNDVERGRSEEWFFTNHVDKSIQKVIDQVMTIQRFSLQARLREPQQWGSALNKWMQQLVEAKVNDLSLLLQCTGPRIHYLLPPIVVLSDTITHLNLRGCKLEQCISVSLPNLLHLTLIEIVLSQEMLVKFITGCPNLEILKLSMLYGLSSICVSGHDRLKEVELTLPVGVTRVTIVAPNLRVFKVMHNYAHVCDAKIDLLACEATMRKLRLSCLNVSAEELRSLVSALLGLEELVLDSLPVESIELAKNQKLGKLEVIGCYQLEKIKIDASNLRVLKYRDNKLPFCYVNSSYSLNHKIDFYAKKFPESIEFDSLSNKRWLGSFEELFVKRNDFKNIKLIVTLPISMDAIVCEDLDDNFIKLLYDVREKIPGIEVVRITTYEYMVERLFGSYDRWKTISIISRDQQSNEKFLEVLRKNTLKENGEPNCCRYEPFECWKHSLRNAEIISGEMTDLFTSFDATEYEITRIKLLWVPRR